MQKMTVSLDKSQTSMEGYWLESFLWKQYQLKKNKFFQLKKID